jgi:hypothetical protein
MHGEFVLQEILALLRLASFMSPAAALCPHSTSRRRSRLAFSYLTLIANYEHFHPTLQPDRNRAIAWPDPSSKLEYTFLRTEGLYFTSFVLPIPSQQHLDSFPFLFLSISSSSHVLLFPDFDSQYDGVRGPQSVGSLRPV